MEKVKYWVWLSTIVGLGSKRFQYLLNQYGSPEEVWKLSSQEIKKISYFPLSLIQQLLDPKIRENVDVHMEKIKENQIQVVTIHEEEYPMFLKTIHDPPVVLYVKGQLIKNEKALAIVGSRRATAYGVKMAETIGKELAKCGITVVSGMARGVDSKAHIGALHEQGRTIAVLGCGLDQAYPPENKDLMERIQSSGAVVSEYVPGMPPLPQNFPARNRIISGISMGVVVIEANEKSGSLITADFALEQGREVFAIPGNVNSFNSLGTNKLIKDGAKIVTCMEDILEEIRVFRNSSFDFADQRQREKNNIFKGLEAEEKALAICIYKEDLHIDQLMEKTGMGMNQINSFLVMLELKGIIEQLPGKIFRFRE